MKIKNLILLGLVLSMGTPSFAKEDEDVSDPGTLPTTVETQGRTLATLTNQVNEVVSKFQTMNGDIARANKKVTEQDKVINDLQTRLQVAEDKVTILLGQLQELRTEGLMKPQASLRFKEYQVYSKGLEYINSRQYEKAVGEFQKFQEENKKSVFSGYAQYWIGEAYYMQNDFPMAVKQFQALLQKEPNNAKASTALYRQGLAFYNLQSFADAKAFFSKVIREYPQSIEAIQSSGQIKRINTIEELKKQQELEMKMVQ